MNICINIKQVLYINYSFKGNDQEENTKIDLVNTEITREYNTPDLSTQSQSENLNHSDKSWIARVWSGIDYTLLKPMLTHSTPCLMETMPGCNRRISRVLTSEEQFKRHTR